MTGGAQAFVHAAADSRQLVRINMVLIAFAAAHMALSAAVVGPGGALGAPLPSLNPKPSHPWDPAQILQPVHQLWLLMHLSGNVQNAFAARVRSPQQQLCTETLLPLTKVSLLPWTFTRASSLV